ncbi:hypothetical protein ACFLRC_03990 [Candidatus Altiarchaeota archaeon]
MHVDCCVVDALPGAVSDADREALAGFNRAWINVYVQIVVYLEVVSYQAVDDQQEDQEDLGGDEDSLDEGPESGGLFSTKTLLLIVLLIGFVVLVALAVLAYLYMKNQNARGRGLRNK